MPNQLPSLRSPQPLALRLASSGPLRTLRRPRVALRCSPKTPRACPSEGADLSVVLPPARFPAPIVAVNLAEWSVPFGCLWPPLSTDAPDATLLRGKSRDHMRAIRTTKGTNGPGPPAHGVRDHPGTTTFQQLGNMKRRSKRNSNLAHGNVRRESKFIDSLPEFESHFEKRQPLLHDGNCLARLWFAFA
jgi:hypothetical protein